MDGKNSGGLNDYTAAHFAAEPLRPPRLSDILLPPTSGLSTIGRILRG